MEILIGADLVPTSSNVSFFSEGKAEMLVGHELLHVLTKADVYSIFNLEVPLCDALTPISKYGPNLIAPTSVIAGYKALNINLLALANNHILDQGEEGLKSTQKILNQNEICFLGAGKNITEAAKPYSFRFFDKKIGVYACAEHEFSIAGVNKAGANPFDPLESLDHVSELKHDCDYVIVLYHGGKEHYRYPSPYLQKVCRKLVDKGADLVVCQHSHCIGCEEKYHDGTIVYGQGNFLFDDSTSEYWQTSLLIRLDQQMRVSYIPLKKNKNMVCLASKDEAQEILNAFIKRSNEIISPGTVEAKYSDLAQSMLSEYLYNFSGKKSIIFKIINRLSGQRFYKWYIARKYLPQNILRIRNAVECEAHRELFLCGVQGKHRK